MDEKNEKAVKNRFFQARRSYGLVRRAMAAIDI
jgi:hypothetical protein